MIRAVTVEIKEFLVARFADEAAFDDLCREAGIAYRSTEPFDARMTGLLKKAESCLPDYIDRFYRVCCKLRPGFAGEIDRLFQATPGLPAGTQHQAAALHSELKVFLSYSRQTKAVADEIDQALQSHGIVPVRDTRDAPYRYNLAYFMQSIRSCRYAIILLSDAFLKSPYCMFEVMELLKEQEYKARLLPVYLDDAQFFKPQERIEYTQYWNSQYEALKAQAGNMELAQAGQVAEDLKVLLNIGLEIDAFLCTLSSMCLIPYNKLKAGGYKELLDIIKSAAPDSPV